MSVVLQSDDSVFEELRNSASNLNIEEINDLQELKDNSLSIKEIKRGSLIIIFTVKNDQTLVKNLERVFNCVFKREKINEVLSNPNCASLTVSGYIFDPQDYYLDYSELSLFISFNLNAMREFFFIEFITLLFLHLILQTLIFLHSCQKVFKGKGPINQICFLSLKLHYCVYMTSLFL